MKKIIILSTLLFGILMLNSCQKDPPVASFTITQTTYKMGQKLTFNNESVNAKDYLWDFGDGKTSTDENPEHTFAGMGDFIITLTATGGGGTDVYTLNITVVADLSGFWYKTLSFGISGTMNITQHDDNTITGSYVYEDGMGTMHLKPTSNISGNAVVIEWEEAAFKFQGTVGASGTTMSGQIIMQGVASGTWSAHKL